MASLARDRKRKRCQKCNQELSHSAYARHLNPAVCSERRSDSVIQPRGDVLSLAGHNDSVSGLDMTSSKVESGGIQASEGEIEVQQEYMHESLNFDAAANDHESVGTPDAESEILSTSESSESEDQASVCISEGEDADIYAEDSEYSTTTCHEQSESSNVVTDVRRGEIKQIAVHICMFLSFFQLVYRISERGLSLLLAFLRALLFWLSSLCPHSSDLKTLRDFLPPNVYFLRKLLGRKSEIESFVVCPKCHSLYKFADCVITHRSGMTVSSKCSYVQYPNHPQLFRRTKCNTLLLKSVKCGPTNKLVPRKVYVYKSLKSSLTKLFSQSGFVQKCELWRNKPDSCGVQFTDVIDGNVWKTFQVVNGRPFLKLPNNLCLKLNLDWFNPFKHVHYSVGVLYFVVENLPRTERYKLENIIIYSCIPGPKEPKIHINSYLRPLVDELLELWNGKLLRTSSLFGVIPVRCALTCVTCDLPATRKLCGFLSFSASQGCSKCTKRFPCEQFGDKLNYSGYDRDQWPSRTHTMHLEQVSEIQAANTASKQQELESLYGTRYSELLRLPYFDIIEYHVVDPMHNMLLGTGKHMMSIWKEEDILKDKDFELIQQNVDRMKVPVNIGRIPFKIESNFASFTADQWKNWICVYSLYCLHTLLPKEHYSCWVLFVEACCYLMLPSVTLQDVEKADEKLIEFCKAFETLYGTEKCTPNMHMHLHIKKSVLNYGPVYGFWCFPFERFNGILGSFQKNWISPELQMLRKFFTYQDLLLSDVSSTLPPELGEFFKLQLGKHGEVSVSTGSVEQSHLDPFSLFEYKKNAICPLTRINATECMFHKVHQRYEKFFNHTEVSWLSDVYHFLYPEEEVVHVPMFHEQFREVNVLGERFLSKQARGKHSSAICAYWPGVGGNVSTTCDQLRVGVVQYFVRHTVQLSSQHGEQKVTHLFAFVHWYRVHPRENWFHPRILVVSPDMQMNGPAVFLPLSRVFASCAVLSETIKFDYGDDSVIVATILSHKFCL